MTNPLLAPGVSTVAPAKVPLKQQRRNLFRNTVESVRAGKLTEEQAGKILSGAGFPADHNPYAPDPSTATFGGAIKAVVNKVEPYKLSHPNEVLTTAKHPARIEDLPRQGGIIIPGSGLAAQILGPLAADAVNNPGGVLSLATHPVRTVSQIAGNLKETVTDPTHHLLNAALLGYAGLSGGAAVTSRVAAKSLRAPAPGTVKLTVQGEGGRLVTERPLSKNALVRPVQRARANRQQKAIDQATVRSPVTGLGRTYRGTFSPQNTVGRDWRAQKRVEATQENAINHKLSRVSSKLSRGEHAALGVVAVEGKGAFLDPVSALARHIGTHEHFGKLGGDVAANELRVADLKLARAALEKPSPKFLRAVALAQQASTETERKLILAEHLDPAVAQGRKDKIAQIYGHAAAPKGSFYYPMTARYTSQPLVPASGGFQGRSPGEFGLGAPSTSAQVPGLHKTFTGESVAQGLTPVNVAATIADRGVRVNKLLAAEDTFKTLWQAGSPAKRSVYDLPIRDTAQIKTELKQFFAKLQDHLHATPDEQMALSGAELTRLTDMLAANEHAGAGVGARIDGVRWVDKRLLSTMGQTSVRGIVEKAADLVTNPIRTADLYLRPAYILNLLGNLGMAGITQGTRVVPALRSSVLAASRDGAENTMLIDSGVGASLSRSYAVPTGLAHDFNQRLAEAWNALTDLHVRRSAFYHEASAAGFRSPAERDRLLHDEKLTMKKTEVFRRANKNMVDFGSLTPVEQNTVRRLIFFYPWVSRATVWSLRMLVEHPGKSFTLAQLGQVGAENAHKQIGPEPGWAEKAGLIAVGARHGDLVSTINLSSINTPASAAQAGEAFIDTLKGLIGVRSAGDAGQLFTPALELANQSVTGGNPTGGPSGLIGLIEGLPQYQALRRAGVVGSPPKTYPTTGADQAAGPLGIGGAFPRPTSLSALHSQGRRAAGGPLERLTFTLAQAVDAGLLTEAQVATMLVNAKKASPAELKAAQDELSAALRG